MKRCFFIGHRDAPAEVFPTLVKSIEHHIVVYGVAKFIIGNYGNFDRMAAKAVIEAKKQHPEITVSLLIPYHPAERPIKLPKGFDNTFYPSDMEKVPRKLAIVCANRYMVDHVDYLIAYAWHPASNAWNLLDYAQHKGVLFMNLGGEISYK